ncbi:MAG: hypothetical protein JWN16_798 [Alphaproteobacteria bacterium]|nr:hypothetical protein [Alphaproteobacteria bacterium]
MIAPEQLKQEARRVLRRLAAPRQGLFIKGAGYAIGRGAESRVNVTAELVQAFARENWIVPDGPGRYVIGAAGRDFLARENGGFAAQHREMQDQVLEGAPVKVNAGESPLARLKARGLVDGVQFAAGEKLRRDFTLAQLTPRVGVNWEAPVVSGSRGAGADSISDIALMARQRLNRALAAIGPGLADLLFDVCCHLTVLERCEDVRGWAKRSGRVVLKIALDRLAVHYGMTVVRRHGKVRAWSAEAAP